MSFHSGYIAILGQPNVGKSTLLNKLVGEPVAIVTPKAQTTRNRIVGILNRPDAQLVFVDTPGYHSVPKLLNQFMLNEIEQAISHCNLFCFLVDGETQNQGRDDELMERLSGHHPIIIVNKADKLERDRRQEIAEDLRDRWDLKELFFISAKSGDGCEELIAELSRRLPEGAAFFPTDQYTELPVRFLAAEAIREQVMLLMHQEVPYGIAVEILSFEEKPTITVIQADIIVERSSHKGIVIGKRGLMIKKIGTRSREKISFLMADQKIFLELKVRVEEDWTRSVEKLRQFGYG